MWGSLLAIVVAIVLFYYVGRAVERCIWPKKKKEKK
jgi:hypothetical protein